MVGLLVVPDMVVRRESGVVADDRLEGLVAVDWEVYE